MMNPLDALLRYPLFGLLDRSWLADWVASGESVSVNVGDVLIRDKTPGEHVCIVGEGGVRVMRTAKDGREVSLGMFGPGDVFGEYALLHPGFNTATCRAVGPGLIHRLPLPPLREAVQTQFPGVQKQLKKWLCLHALLGYVREASFLGFISSTSVLPLLDHCFAAGFEAERTIQAEGLNADRWFVIQSGEVTLITETETGERTRRVLRRGDCFGEAALAGRDDLPTAEAVTATRCLSLGRDALCRPPGSTVHFAQQSARSDPVAVSPAFPWVGQQEAVDCGAAALAMVARFHHRLIPLEEVGERIREGDRGANLLQLVQAATAVGFRARAVRISPEQLGAVTLPAIAHLGHGHYVVIYAAGAAEVVVGDPAQGVVLMDVATFRQQWSGHLLLLTPGHPVLCRG